MAVTPNNVKLASDLQLLMLYVYITRIRAGMVLFPPADLTPYQIDRIEVTLMAEIDKRPGHGQHDQSAVLRHGHLAPNQHPVRRLRHITL